MRYFTSPREFRFEGGTSEERDEELERFLSELTREVEDAFNKIAAKIADFELRITDLE